MDGFESSQSNELNEIFKQIGSTCGAALRLHVVWRVRNRAQQLELSPSTLRKILWKGLGLLT